jgi:hypothetical protein
MSRLFVFGLLGFGIYYTVIGGSGIFASLTKNNAALALQGISEEDLNVKIIEHYKKTVLGGADEFTPDAIETTVADLNDDGKNDVIAVTESNMTCGSGGCIATIFIKNDANELMAIPFSYAVKRIEVLGSLTQGMHDLRINDDKTHRMIWNGTTYVMDQTN